MNIHFKEPMLFQNLEIHYKAVMLLGCGIAGIPRKLKTELGDNCIQNFHLGSCIVGYMVGNLVLRRAEP